MSPSTDNSAYQSGTSTLPSYTNSPPVGIAPIAASDRLVKAKSEQSLPVSQVALESSLNKMKSRSLEPLSGLAMWTHEPVEIELQKGDRGLGFSILDYQVSASASASCILGGKGERKLKYIIFLFQ